MAEIMTKVDVATDATLIGSFKSWFMIKNVSDATIYFSFVSNGATTLTTANGFPLGVNESIFSNREDADLSMALKHPIYAIHGGVGTKEVRVQGE